MADVRIHQILGAVTALCMAGAAATAHADTVLPFTPTLTIGSTSLDNDAVSANPDGTFSMSGEQKDAAGIAWDIHWNLTVSQDPFILGSVSVTNLGSTTKNFNVVLSVPVVPPFSPSKFGGSIDANVVDTSNNGSATLAPISSTVPIYRGTIDGILDGNTALRLFAISLSCSSGGGCLAAGSDGNGLPGPTLPGPGVASSIGTLLSFSLTAGDTATFTTNFTVEPVPLPAALPMMLLGLGSLAAARRRRTAR